MSTSGTKGKTPGPRAYGGPFRATGSALIKADRVKMRDTSQTIGHAETPGLGSPEPQILLHRRDNVIESIEIVCSCGKRIHVQCEYGQGGTN